MREFLHLPTLKDQLAIDTMADGANIVRGEHINELSSKLSDQSLVNSIISHYLIKLPCDWANGGHLRRFQVVCGSSFQAIR